MANNLVRPQFTPQQRSFIVTQYHRTQSVAAVLRRFCQEYPDVRCPSRKTIMKNVQKYQATGTSRNLNKKRSGRRRTGRSVANVQAVQDALQDHAAKGGQRLSCRRNGLGLTPSTFNPITRLDLNLYAYQMIKRHQLFPGDFERRQRFCTWLLQQGPRFLDHLIIGDEAGFFLNAMVNAHNVKDYQPRGQPDLGFDCQRNDDRHKITVWIGLVGSGLIIGPFFFRQNVNGEVYLHFFDLTDPICHNSLAGFSRFFRPELVTGVDNFEKERLRIHVRVVSV